MDGVMSCFPKTMQHPTATCHGAGKADDDARRRNAGDAATARPGPWWPGRQAVEGEDGRTVGTDSPRSEEHTSELQSQSNLVCRLLLEKKKKKKTKRVPDRD